MKGLRTVIASALAIGLMLSSVGGVFAEEPTKTNIFGKVIAKDQASLSEGFVEIKTKQGEIIRMKVTADTQYNSGSFQDIATEKRVALVADEADGVLVAEKLLLVPEEPINKHLVGVVKSVSGNTASVSNEEGGEIFAFNIEPIVAVSNVNVEPGQLVTAVVAKDLRATKVMAVCVASTATTTNENKGKDKGNAKGETKAEPC